MGTSTLFPKEHVLQKQADYKETNFTILQIPNFKWDIVLILIYKSFYC